MTFLRLGEGFNTLPNMDFAGHGAPRCCRVWMGEGMRRLVTHQELHAL